MAGQKDNMARQTARHNVVSGLALIALAGFFFYSSYSISLDFVDEEGVGPRFFPQAICVALGGIGAVLVFFGLRGQSAPADKSTFEAYRFLVDALPLFALGLAFVWVFGAFGYVVACSALLFAALWLFGVRGLELALMCLLTTAVLYLLFFKLMAVFEPAATIVNPLTLLGLN